MTSHRNAGLAVAAAVLSAALVGGCTGGSESSAAVERENAESAAEENVDPKQALGTINPAIPIYQGAQYRSDMTRRDEIMIRNRYGDGAEVYTLATNDSFPQVYHYYTTYLAQFRAFPAQATYPSDKKNWRTLEVKLNEAMQDPFIPGAALDPNGKQILLQIAETEAQPKTVIRYIVTPPPPAGAVAVAAASPDPDQQPAAP